MKLFDAYLDLVHKFGQWKVEGCDVVSRLSGNNLDTSKEPMLKLPTTQSLYFSVLENGKGWYHLYGLGSQTRNLRSEPTVTVSENISKALKNSEIQFSTTQGSRAIPRSKRGKRDSYTR